MKYMSLSSIVALGMVVLLLGCNTTPVEDGAVLGSALGAATGAIIGHQSGHQGEGALIGAGIGAISGAIVGDQVQRNQRQRPVVREQNSAGQAQRYRYETQLFQAPSGEYYEKEVLVPY